MTDVLSRRSAFGSLPRSRGGRRAASAAGVAAAGRSLRRLVGVGAAPPLLLLALGCLLLTACGRTGDIRAPGPPEQITYPRVYPAPDRAPQPQPSARP
jgi:hypothetical protein